jgi:Uma2 family endonuclease
METPRHRDQMNLLIDSLKAHWSDRTGYFVGGNMFLHYDPENRRRTRGPDFFLVLNVEDRERKSWVVWFEGMRFPDVIIELLSDSTRSEDEGPKKTLYAELFRTPEYYLYDPYSQAFTGYQLHGSHYVEMERDTEGRMYSEVTELYLGVRDSWLRWITLEGEVVASPSERAEQEHQRAEQEHQRAEQERQRAEQEHQRAEQAERLAQDERQRAEQAEAMLEAYRRRFGSLE